MLLHEYLKQEIPRIIIADFDDTLIDWLDIDSHNADAVTWDKQHLITEDWYDKHRDRFRPNKDMQEFFAMWSNKVNTCYVLSWRDTNISLPSLEKIVEEFYPNIFRKVLISGTREAKVDVLKSIEQAHDVSFSEILLIDDHPETRHEIRALGCKACSPGAIRHFLEEYVPDTHNGDFEDWHSELEEMPYIG